MSGAPAIVKYLTVAFHEGSISAYPQIYRVFYPVLYNYGALEGQSYFDLLPWKQGSLLSEDIKGIKKEWAVTAEQAGWNLDDEGYIVFLTDRIFIDPKNYRSLVPLIQRERNLNLSQNTGW